MHALAATRAKAWNDRIIIYVGDNTNVIGWLNTRTSNNRYARFLLRVLVRMEAHYGFQTLAVYIRTANNVFADDLTRLPFEQARSLLATRGLEEIDLSPAWREHISHGWVHGVLSWLGDDGEARRVASQLKEKRVHRAVPRPLAATRFPNGLVVGEWRATVGTYA